MKRLPEELHHIVAIYGFGFLCTFIIVGIAYLAITYLIFLKCIIGIFIIAIVCCSAYAIYMAVTRNLY